MDLKDEIYAPGRNNWLLGGLVVPLVPVQQVGQEGLGRVFTKGGKVAAPLSKLKEPEKCLGRTVRLGERNCVSICLLQEDILCFTHSKFLYSIVWTSFPNRAHTGSTWTCASLSLGCPLARIQISLLLTS